MDRCAITLDNITESLMDKPNTSTPVPQPTHIDQRLTIISRANTHHVPVLYDWRGGILRSPMRCCLR